MCVEKHASLGIAICVRETRIPGKHIPVTTGLITGCGTIKLSRAENRQPFCMAKEKPGYSRFAYYSVFKP